MESRKRLAEKPLRDAATEMRAKVKRADAARDKLEAVQYLKDNKDYEARFMATIKAHTSPRQSQPSRIGMTLMQILCKPSYTQYVVSLK